MMIARRLLPRWGTALTAALLAAGCSATPTTAPQPSAPSNATRDSNESAQPTSTGGAEDGGVRLGDQNQPADADASGAPFDPCTVGWRAFPEPVRPQPETTPTRLAPQPQDPFTTSCRYDNSVNLTEAGGDHFITRVFWAQPGAMPVDPSSPENKGTEPATFSGKQGLVRSGTNKTSQEPTCGVLVALANGTAGVLVTNGRFPAVDTCTIARTVADTIAASTP